MVDFPDPDAPTRAEVWPGAKEIVRPFRTVTSGRDGYLNWTSARVIAPATSSNLRPSSLALSISGLLHDEEQKHCKGQSQNTGLIRLYGQLTRGQWSQISWLRRLVHCEWLRATGEKCSSHTGLPTPTLHFRSKQSNGEGSDEDCHEPES